MDDTTAAPTASAPDDLVRQATAIGRGTLVERLGIELVEVSADRVVATMPVEGNTQPQGLLHGGASVALAETLGSFGAFACAAPGSVVLGIDINATHHRAARSGLVTGVARPLHVGSTMTSWQVEVTDGEGRLVCTSRITCMIRPPRD